MDPIDLYSYKGLHENIIINFMPVNLVFKLN